MDTYIYVGWYYKTSPVFESDSTYIAFAVAAVVYLLMEETLLTQSTLPLRPLVYLPLSLSICLSIYIYIII